MELEPTRGCGVSARPKRPSFAARIALEVRSSNNMEYSIVLAWRVGKWASKCRCRVELVEEEARERSTRGQYISASMGNGVVSSRRTGAVA